MLVPPQACILDDGPYELVFLSKRGVDLQMRVP